MLIKAENSFVLFLIYVILPIANQVNSVCIFGPGCVLPCRCQAGECDSQTGECESNCSAVPSLWSGPGCQIGNIADGNRSFTTNSIQVIDPSFALTDSEYVNSNSCVFIDTNDHWDAPFITVDFGTKYAIQSVDIYSKLLDEYTDRFRAKFKIEVSNSSEFASYILCGAYEDSFPDNGKVTIECGTKLIAQYVKVVRQAVSSDVDPHPDRFHVCEVVIIGHVYLDIDCAQCVTQSNDGSAFCGNGIWCEECEPGFEPPDCRPSDTGAITQTPSVATTTRTTTVLISTASTPSSTTVSPTTTMTSMTSHVTERSHVTENGATDPSTWPETTSVSSLYTESNYSSVIPTSKDNGNSDTSVQLIIYTIVAIVLIVLVTLVSLAICVCIRRHNAQKRMGDTPNSTLSRRNNRHHQIRSYNDQMKNGYSYDEEYAANLSRTASLRSLSVMDTIHEEKESSKHSSCSSLHGSTVKAENSNSLNGSIKRYSNRSL